jgi:alkanesulfonate monooxygenase SsuD/methylene tetrahydromethanopterin reductase-like flavin-dependent oxidoreductase (luciferase family)
MEALDIYRDAFRASPVLDAPYAIVTANVLVAPTDDEAEWQAAPGQLMIHAIRRGRFEPLLSPDAAAAHPLIGAARALPTNRIVGSPATALGQLDDLVAASAADEIMVSAAAFDLAARVRSLALLAEAWAPPQETGESGEVAGPGWPQEVSSTSDPS